jgi:hypothetical protein
LVDEPSWYEEEMTAFAGDELKRPIIAITTR